LRNNMMKSDGGPAAPGRIAVQYMYRGPNCNA
jgi:hypothetical protein